jgi:chromate transporter
MPAVLITGVSLISIKNTDSNRAQYSCGIKPAIIAIILAAIYPLAEIFKNDTAGNHCGWTLVLSLLKYNEIYILFGAGFLAFLYSKFKAVTHSA